MTSKRIHNFLLQEYSKVNAYLSTKNPESKDLPGVVVSFCTVTEKILKLKLQKKSPILIYDISNLKDEDKLLAIALRKKNDIHTAKIEVIIRRFRVSFVRTFSDDEELALLSIYKLRNQYIHSAKADNEIDIDEIDLLSKMGVLWNVVSDMAEKLLGKKEIKKISPVKQYSEKELEEVLKKEVMELIANHKADDSPFLTQDFGVSAVESLSSVYSSKECCPRCRKFSFSKDDDDGLTMYQKIYLNTSDYRKVKSNLYKCSSCNLELTEKQYKIAKKLILN